MGNTNLNDGGVWGIEGVSFACLFYPCKSVREAESVLPDTEQHISISGSLRWKSSCFICSPTLVPIQRER